MAFGALPKDSGLIPISSVYVPNNGNFIALAGATQTYSDSASNVSTYLLSNIDNISLIASAAYTTTQTPADQTNFLGRGVIVVLDMTVVTAGPSVTLEIDGKDPVSGKYY